ncbi:CGNR zinc finger domain-containing protein [Streptomyces sp. A7024]|uniref:CGNR zinc finger domain-containing protein n=1 Tax=Streptomyces coryli TaxID=1128680 RepID=A0A6G4UDU8_9ACTN|nr:CGNR zinc finger domain-containing protein [Streptomyces coryli]NGN69527.1 CGNR zinc finger domain-containing protein [Streptomyces coryli]
MSSSDPRPLTGEPLAIDLLNTRWMDGDHVADLLDSTEGLAVWLASPPVAAQLPGPAPRADAATLDALHRARAALAKLVDDPADPAGRRDLNTVLSHARVRHVLDPEGPATRPEADAPAWLPAWAAAENYLRLLEDRPDRIRPCAGPTCILHFYDVSKNGTRRWCSMAICGNRSKAKGHYRRTHAT